jgi:hypothetical protein
VRRRSLASGPHLMSCWTCRSDTSLHVSFLSKVGGVKSDLRDVGIYFWRRQAIVNAVIAAACNGDMTAAKIILDRIAPVRRSSSFDLPRIEGWADVGAARAPPVCRGKGCRPPWRDRSEPLCYSGNPPALKERGSRGDYVHAQGIAVGWLRWCGCPIRTSREACTSTCGT